MIYRDMCGEQVSVYGMGCMRLPVIDGDDAMIDEAAALELYKYAYDHGVNYFDTAWGYHGGNSELVTGKALAKYPRDSFYVASKWPGYDVTNFGKAAEIFEKQLEKVGVDYFDFYLAHNINESNIDFYMDDDTYGTISYLVEQKKAGRIKHLGFSVHGQEDVLARYLEKYADDMEFCQIQLNYLDWEFQDAKAKVDMLNALAIPIIVMEPLRGGNLINLTDEQAAKLAAMRPDASLAEWAMLYPLQVEGVTTVLSGATTLEQMAENIKIYEEAEPLSEAEVNALYEVAADIVAKNALPCTACKYCVSHCPLELDIPYLIMLYNENTSREEGRFIAPMAISALPEDKRPKACIGCGKCAAVCPQQIDIPDAMEKFAEMLGF